MTLRLRSGQAVPADREREPDRSDRATQRETELRDDAIAAIVARLPCGPDHEFCRLCDEPIGLARRRALPGVETCIDCQSDLDGATGATR